MSKYEEYLANAAECQRMARVSQNDSEKRLWHQMADSWSRMADAHAPQSGIRVSTNRGDKID